ncbi:hypothetical protein AAMO2058_001179000 [Amorphochlora amoebiformis]
MRLSRPCVTSLETDVGTSQLAFITPVPPLPPTVFHISKALRGSTLEGYEMSNPPWATSEVAAPKGHDFSLRTKDINIPKRRVVGQRNSPSLQTSDIVLPRRRHTNRIWGGSPVTNLNTNDIAGQYRKYQYPIGPSVESHGSGNRPNHAYDSRDIDGAYCKRQRDPRNTNPLNPTYKLPSAKVEIPPEPRFIRDNIGVGDITGARAKPRFQRAKIRPTNETKDIAGARSTPKTYERKNTIHKTDNLDVSDITRTQFKSKRVNHNPLNPTYIYGKSKLANSTLLGYQTGGKVRKEIQQEINTKTNREPVVLGEIEGSRPAVRRPRKSKELSSFGLRTSDVDGASAKWKPSWIPKRTTYRNPNRTDDIKGAAAGTKTRALRSNRKTDPLQPRYRYLGNPGSEKLKSTGREISQVIFG